MKLVHITFQFQYADAIEEILADHGVDRYVSHQMVAGVDRDGRHDGSKVYPGHVTAVQALVADDQVEPLLEALAEFRGDRPAHEHLEAAVIAVEHSLSSSTSRSTS